MDEELVRKFAAENKIPFYSVRFETKEYAQIKGLSVQMAARELRYRWFEKIRKENNYDSIAVAHNLNDNIETLAYKSYKRNRIAGLTGMRPVSNKIIRPCCLLHARELKNIAAIIRYRSVKTNPMLKPNISGTKSGI